MVNAYFSGSDFLELEDCSLVSELLITSTLKSDAYIWSYMSAPGLFFSEGLLIYGKVLTHAYLSGSDFF